MSADQIGRSWYCYYSHFIIIYFYYYSLNSLKISFQGNEQQPPFLLWRHPHTRSSSRRKRVFPPRQTASLTSASLPRARRRPVRGDSTCTTVSSPLPTCVEHCALPSPCHGAFPSPCRGALPSPYRGALPSPLPPPVSP